MKQNNIYSEHTAEQSRLLEEVRSFQKQNSLTFAEALAIIRIQRDDIIISLLKRIADNRS